MNKQEQEEYVRPTWISGWYRFDAGLQKLERGLLVVGMFTILIVGCFHILARNTLGQGIPFSDTLAQHLTVWLGLLGATLAASSSEHISIDAFSRVLRGKGLQVSKLVIGVVSTILCGVLTYRTVLFVIFAIKDKGSVHFGNINIPLWYFVLIFPYAFGLITLRYLIQTIEYGLRPASSFVQEQDVSVVEEANEVVEEEPVIEEQPDAEAQPVVVAEATDVEDEAKEPELPTKPASQGDES